MTTTVPEEIPVADDGDAAEPAPAPAAKVQGVGLFARLTETEPVRLWLYTVLGAVLAVLVVYGVLDSEQVAVWSGVGAAVLGVPVTEFLRGQVYSPRSYNQGVTR